MISWLLACSTPPLFVGNGLEPVQAAGLSARACAECHAEITASWTASRHRAAWTNPVFAASVDGSLEKQWCMNCHAPLPAQQASLHAGELGLAAEGVTCVVCHERGGVLITAREPSPAAIAMHPIRKEARLGESAFCAGCHQFSFIDPHQLPGLVPLPLVMQDTYGEWKRSGEERSCQSCHVQGHRFPGAHDPQLLAGEISAEVKRGVPFALATVRSEGIAHSFPSGDPFRRLELWICEDPVCEQVFEKRRFHRLFSGAEGGELGLLEDRSIPAAGERSLSVAVPEQAFWWELRYFFGDARHERGLAADEVIRVITSGQVAPLFE